MSSYLRLIEIIVIAVFIPPLGGLQQNKCVLHLTLGGLSPRGVPRQPTVEFKHFFINILTIVFHLNVSYNKIADNCN